MAKKRNKSKYSGTKRNRLSDCVKKSVNRYLKDLNGEDTTRLYKMVVDEVEKPLLEVVMQYSEFNQSRAARLLGINRNTLRKKLDDHGIVEEENR
ncbi:MAG: DNA-binding transcriptional regulator Fis [bacterium]